MFFQFVKKKKNLAVLYWLSVVFFLNQKLEIVFLKCPICIKQHYGLPVINPS